MTKRPPYQDKLHIDMPFNEALERFIGTDPKHVQANIKRAKKKRPPGGKKPPPDDPTNVASLRDARIKRRNKGR